MASSTRFVAICASWLFLLRTARSTSPTACSSASLRAVAALGLLTWIARRASELATALMLMKGIRRPQVSQVTTPSEEGKAAPQCGHIVSSFMRHLYPTALSHSRTRASSSARRQPRLDRRCERERAVIAAARPPVRGAASSALAASRARISAAISSRRLSMASRSWGCRTCAEGTRHHDSTCPSVATPPCSTTPGRLPTLTTVGNPETAHRPLDRRLQGSGDGGADRRDAYAAVPCVIKSRTGPDRSVWSDCTRPPSS